MAAPGGGYPGAPSAPPAPSASQAPSSYQGQAWQQPGYDSATPQNYSSAPPSYSSAPPAYTSSPSSLSYNSSQRYNAQSSFGSSGPPTSTPYSDQGQKLNSTYGQPPASNSYGQAPLPGSAGYGQTQPPPGSYGDPAKLGSSYQSQTPPSYGQAPSGYGQTPQPSNYWKPTSQPSGYGQAPQYGQSYGQQSQYPAGSYPPVYGAYGQNQPGQPESRFPPGTDPEIIRAFELGDIDGSGAIDAVELGRVLSSGLPFSLRTVNLMLHLYSTHRANKIGPTEFVALWNALKEWKLCFEKFDRDRSGNIDFNELRNALLSMGYAISPPLLEILISKYDRTGQARAMDYDNFVECGFVVKGLTDRFKAKDPRYTGSATIDFESFMKMVLPFIVA